MLGVPLMLWLATLSFSPNDSGPAPERGPVEEETPSDVGEADAQVEAVRQLDEPEALTGQEPEPEAEPKEATAAVEEAPTNVGRSMFRPLSPAESPGLSDELDLESGVPPGGYWAPGEAPESAPKDGADERLAGYITVPLGALTAASGIAMVYLTMPGQCVQRTRAVGYNLNESQCQSLLILNGVRVAYGGLAVITGAVLLAIGHRRKRKLEEWNRRRFRASIGGSARGDMRIEAQVGWRF